VSCYVLPIFEQVEPNYCTAVLGPVTVLIAIAPAVFFGVDFVIVVAVSSNCFCFLLLFLRCRFVVVLAISETDIYRPGV